jgi:hypothetical protein
MELKIHRFIIALIFMSNAAWSAPSEEVMIGDVALIIPPPSGLQNTEPDAKKITDEASKLVGQQSKFLLAFVPYSAIAESNVSKTSVYLSRYAIVSIENNYENILAQPSDFKHVQDYLLTTVGTQDLITELNELEAARNKKFKANEATRTRLISKSSTHISLANAISYSIGNTSGFMYVVMSYILVKGKILTVVMYYNPPSKKDVNEAADTASRWAQSILAANADPINLVPTSR